MNTTEKIAESYFRIVKKCFTMPDLKVLKGNNRQFDLLAINLTNRYQYHVEVSVKNDIRWSPDIKNLEVYFNRKFLGIPRKREGDNTDWTKKKSYYQNILNTYESVGFSSERIRRVWISWVCRNSKSELNDFLKKYSKDHGFKHQIRFISFRDEILPQLIDAVEKSNYEDDSLRTLSLLKCSRNT